MTKFVMFAATLLAPLSLFAFDAPKVVVLERLHEFEPHLRAAADEHNLNVEFHAAHPAPHFTATLAPKFESVSALTMYRKVTGRPEDARLELRQASTRRIVVAHEFRIGTDDASRRSAAREFVRKLRRHLDQPVATAIELRD